MDQEIRSLSSGLRVEFMLQAALKQVHWQKNPHSKCKKRRNRDRPNQDGAAGVVLALAY